MKTLKLAHVIPATGGQAQYKVLIVKNSTVYHPGQMLAKDEVEGLCRASHWDVTIVSVNAPGAAT